MKDDFNFVLARETVEEGTHCGTQWGGEGNEVKVPSSIPYHFVKWAPFFSRFTGEDDLLKLKPLRPVDFPDRRRSF